MSTEVGATCAAKEEEHHIIFKILLYMFNKKIDNH